MKGNSTTPARVPGFLESMKAKLVDSIPSGGLDLSLLNVVPSQDTARLTGAQSQHAEHNHKGAPQAGHRTIKKPSVGPG